MQNRPRRLRLNQHIRNLVQEHSITAHDLIYPVFIKEGENSQEAISSMPGIYRWGTESILRELEEAQGLGISAIALFPVIDDQFKTLNAEESYNPEGLTQRAIRRIKEEFPGLLLITDVALDPYTIHGHDGILEDGKIVNDKTVEILTLMSLAQAEAGSDIVAPSDMMDGRISAIRHKLDKHGYDDTLIMAYTAKYASSLYAPFREALSSLGAKKSNTLTLEKELSIPQDKKTYQMNIANSKEALKELELDLAEGADIVMVKPAGWYLDIVQQFKSKSNVPIAAYQVSGEYSMIHAAAKAGYIDLDKAIYESLISIKRAGADLILSYFAKDFLQSL